MMLASRHSPSMLAGSSGRSCCRSAPYSDRFSRHTRRISSASPETHAPTCSRWYRTSAARSGRPTGDRIPHHIGPRTTAQPWRYLLKGWVGCDPKPRAGLDKGLESPADQVGPAFRKPLDKLRFDGTDCAEGKLHTGAVVTVAQLEGGDAERNAQMKRPGQLQVAVVRPAGDRREDRAAVLPCLDDQAAQPPFETEARGVRAQIRVSPPAA